MKEPNRQLDPAWLAPRGERPRRSHGVLVFLLGVACYLPPAARCSLWDRDEARYAQIAREMYQRGDWLIPHYRGEPYFVKPPLLYWAVFACFETLGQSELSIRMVPIISLALTLVVIYRHAARMHSRRLGLLAAGIFGTTLLAAVTGSMLLTDGPLVLLTTVAITCWIESLLRGPRRRRSVAFWVAVALAVLTKGPVIFLFLLPMGVVLCWRHRRCRDRVHPVLGCMHPKWGIPLFVVLAGWWYVAAAGLAGEAFVSRFLIYDLWDRLFVPIEGHGGPPGYYLLMSLALLLPWSPLLPGMLGSLWRRRGERPWIGVLLAWLIAPWPLLEVIRTKLPHYILPCYPAFALLQGLELLRLAEGGRDLYRTSRAARIGVLLWALLPGVLLLSGFTIAARFGLGAVLLPTALAGAGCLAGGCFVARFGLAGRTVPAAGGAIAVSVVFFQIIGWWQLPRLEPYRIGRIYAEQARAMARPGDRFAVLGFDEPSVRFYLGPGELPVAMKVVDVERLDAMLAAGPIVVLADEPNFRRLDRWRGRTAGRWRQVRGLNYAKWTRRDGSALRPQAVVLHVGRVEPPSGLDGVDDEHGHRG